MNRIFERTTILKRCFSGRCTLKNQKYQCAKFAANEVEKFSNASESVGAVLKVSFKKGTVGYYGVLNKIIAFPCLLTNVMKVYAQFDEIQSTEAIPNCRIEKNQNWCGNVTLLRTVTEKNLSYDLRTKNGEKMSFVAGSRVNLILQAEGEKEKSEIDLSFVERYPK